VNSARYVLLAPSGASAIRPGLQERKLSLNAGISGKAPLLISCSGISSVDRHRQARLPGAAETLFSSLSRQAPSKVEGGWMKIRQGDGRIGFLLRYKAY